MDDPISQAGDVANGMLNPLTVANFTEKYWTQDCHLVHPQMCLKGQKAIYMAYKLWGVLNIGKARWKTSDIAIDQNGHRVMMHGDSICCLFGVLCFRLNWYVTLTLEDDSRKKLIKKQHNHLLIAETFLYQLPLVGRFFQSTVPRVGALIGLAGMQAAGKLLKTLGYDSELAQVSSHGTNYLNIPMAWQEGTTDILVAPRAHLRERH